MFIPDTTLESNPEIISNDCKGFFRSHRFRLPTNVNPTHVTVFLHASSQSVELNPSTSWRDVISPFSSNQPKPFLLRIKSPLISNVSSLAKRKKREN